MDKAVEAGGQEAGAMVGYSGYLKLAKMADAEKLCWSMSCQQQPTGGPNPGGQRQTKQHMKFVMAKSLILELNEPAIIT